jgi:hypothetical protein
MIPTDWSLLDSSNVEAMKYDPDKGELHVKFKTGGTYIYEAVPPDVAEDMYHAPSAGRFVQENLKGQYQHRRA